jgi:membrane-associated phospholipid phosphatase
VNPSRRKTLACGIALYAAISLAYTITNVSHRTPPMVLPWSAVDAAIPFLDWSIWIYLSHFALIAWSVFANAAQEAPERLIPAAWAGLLSTAFFFAFPTTIIEWPGQAGPVSAYGFRLIGLLNTPANSLPSMHVALAALAAWSLRRPSAGAWAALIALSTLTAKQHTAIDVPAGLALAWLSVRLPAPRRELGSLLRAARTHKKTGSGTRPLMSR